MSTKRCRDLDGNKVIVDNDAKKVKGVEE